MKEFLLQRVQQCRYIALLLLTVCAFANANADENTPATSDEINAAIVAEGSVPLTWTNNAEHPWYIDRYWNDGMYKQRLTIDIGEEGICTSVVKFSYSSEHTTELTFNWYRDCPDQSDWDHNLEIIVDGERKRSNGYTYESVAIVIPSGTHIVEFSETREYSGSNYFTYISELSVREIQSPWFEVTVNAPGQFVSSLVDVLGDKTIQDVELLKISGSINEVDWEAIKQLKEIRIIDFVDTHISSIPDNAYLGLNHLYSVILPETLLEIGREAFKSTNIYEISIPASVSDIKYAAFINTPLSKITFAENSNLKIISAGLFNGTNLEELIMPDSVEDIWITEKGGGGVIERPFDNCRYLKNVKLSNSLTGLRSIFYGSNVESIVIPEGVRFIDGSTFRQSKIKDIVLPESLEDIGGEAFRDAKNLTSITLPQSLTKIGSRAFCGSNITSIVIPSNVTSIGEGTFINCNLLKDVTLNSHIDNFYRTFEGCNTLETITIPSVTPPSVRYDGDRDPFNGVDKSTVTVLVPEFALASYKIDPYWFQFANIRSSVEISEGDYWAIHGHLKLNPYSTFSGNPSIELDNGGIIEIAAETRANFNEFTFNTQEALPSCFLNESSEISANSLTAKFIVPGSGQWYFFSPVTDVRMADVTYPATESWVIRYYDGNRRATENNASGNWVKVPADGTLKRGQGYIIQAAVPGSLYMPAPTSEVSTFFGLEEAPLTLADNACETAENAGWNLVGNPYPAFYDIYSIDLQAPITVWNGLTYRAYSLTDDDFVLSPMQPFFVQKSSAALSLEMPRGGRQTTGAVIRAHAPRLDAIDSNRHKLNLEIVSGDNDSADDYTRIVINDGASLGYEGACDASKFMSMNKNIAQIYSLGEKRHALAINERPYADGNVALGVYLPAVDGFYRIAASRSDRKAWIYDSSTGIEQDLTEGDYVFTAEKSGTDTSRFSIRFAPTETTAVDGVAADAFKVVGGKGAIKVSAPADAEIIVHSVAGTVVANMKGSSEIPANAGVYVVNVNGQSFKTIVK